MDGQGKPGNLEDVRKQPFDSLPCDCCWAVFLLKQKLIFMCFMSCSVSSSLSHELGSINLLFDFTDEETGSEELSNLSEVTQCRAGIQTQGA